MPNLSWNEIRQRVIQFSREWRGVGDERAEAQTFWNEFFIVFGKKRRLLASFEEKVKSLKDTYHRIDLFWPGTLLAEHKSAGQDLGKAQSQAFQYITELASMHRESEIPRYVVVSDFARMVLYDLEAENQADAVVEFPLQDLHRHIKHFAFFIGQQTHRFGEEDPANLEAAAIMAELHDAIEAGNYRGAALERLLVRLLFCLFADDTGIFETSQFDLFLENRTREDGSDLGAQMNHLFEVLNTPPEQRITNLDEDLADFPYINGDLFKDPIHTAGFNRDMRNRLLAACRFDWSRISPAIFGSLFQGILDDRERRQIGAHYTSERDILKLIRPLFLDELHAEFEQIKKDTRKGNRDARLRDFRERLTQLRFLDPACGCGNFLVIAYRELRSLEHRILDELYDFKKHGEELDLGAEGSAARIDVNQFYGIEIGEWPARIAETALWLTDHQMNVELSLKTGNLFQRIPLKACPHIRCANALRMDWNDLLPASECAYVMGNPPFVGKHLVNEEQRQDIERIFENAPGSGSLDYVTCWYYKAAAYTASYSSIRCAFVSTNSISQGEQVAYLWSILFRQKIKIHFAHRTFSWESEAKGKAHVHVVIIGFGHQDLAEKRIYDYSGDKFEPNVIKVKNISPYLVEGSDLIVLPRSTPLCDIPPTMYGNKPVDGGHLIIDADEKVHIETTYPEITRYILPLVCAQEYLHGKYRYCFWFQNEDLKSIRNHPYIQKKLLAVRDFRAASTKVQTREFASVPYRFAEIRQPEGEYIVIPQHTSENRLYIPFGYFQPSTIIHNSCTALPNATPYHFGVLTSAMHMAWVRQVCGRLKSDYRYSAKLVYNNFPWPMEATAEQRAQVETCAQAVLNVRQGYLDDGSTLADLYDPLYMPAPLLKAHQALDRAVDRCYRSAKFTSERERVEYLFQQYERLTAPLAPSEKQTSTKKK